MVDQYDRIVGPLLVGLMVRTVFMVIQSINDMVYQHVFNWLTLVEILLLILEVMLLALVELGHSVKKRVRR